MRDLDRYLTREPEPEPEPRRDLDHEAAAMDLPTLALALGTTPEALIDAEAADWLSDAHEQVFLGRGFPARPSPEDLETGALERARETWVAREEERFP